MHRTQRNCHEARARVEETPELRKRKRLAQRREQHRARER